MDTAEQTLAALNANLPWFCVYRTVYYPDGRMDCDYVSPNLEYAAKRGGAGSRDR